MAGNVNPHFQSGMGSGPGGQMGMPIGGGPQQHPPMYQQGPQGQVDMHGSHNMMQGNNMGGVQMNQAQGMIPNTIPGQQNPNAGPPPQPPNPMVTFANASTSQLTKLGMEHIQEIVSKTTELFQLLRSIQAPVLQVPNAHPLSLAHQEERKAKIAESMNRISFLFKRLRKIYEKVSDDTTQMEFVQIEHLIPLKKAQVNGKDTNCDDKMDTESAQKIAAEKASATELLKLKNRQIKEMIDLLREFVSDINVMLAMRKP